MTHETVQKEMVIVLRTKSALRINENAELVLNASSVIGPVQITYRTRYVHTADRVKLPGDLWVEIRGEADKLDDALLPFANAGLVALPLLTLSANAAVGEADIELGFDDTAGLAERDYFQNYIEPESTVLHVGRSLNMEVTVALLNSLDKHPDSERLSRGANQYRLALLSWRLGREAVCLAHLWMAVEAITKARVRVECRSQGVSNQYELAAKLGIDIRELDGVIRRDYLLDGDTECYEKAKKASDGFEHGFLPYDEIRELSTDVRQRMARYVRNAILEMAGLIPERLSVLTGHPFDKPLGYWPLAKYIRGKLIGSGNKLSAPGNAYPFIRWTPTIKSSRQKADGSIELECTETLTVELAEGIGYQQRNLEVWEAD